MLFDIPECNFNTLQEKLAKIERKAKKYNCEFSFNVVNTEIREKAIKNSNGEILYYSWSFEMPDGDLTVEITRQKDDNNSNE